MNRYSPLFLLLAATWAVADSVLPDPTRPPAWQAADMAADPDASTQLQMVILHKDAKPIAVINGERHVAGDKIGDAKIVRITEDAVQLQGSDGLRTLRMSPNVEKKSSIETIKFKSAKKAVSASARRGQ